MLQRRKLFPVLLLLLVLTGCTARQKTDALPQLRIGCDDYAPYNYRGEDGDPAGMDVELAEEACARMGYEPVFVTIDWEERDALLASGEIDCLWSCYAMDGLENDYDWAGPYMYSRQVVAVVEDSPITSLSELAGRSVAVRTGGKAERILLEHTGIPEAETVYSLGTMEELSTALRSGYVDACAGYAAALRTVLQNDEVAFRFLSEDLSHVAIGVAFPKGGGQLCEALSDTLSEMLRDGTTEKILAAYGVDTEKALGRLRDA